MIASPEDALQSVRTAMLLGAVLPEMRQRGRGAGHDLAGLLKVRKEIAAERDRLKGEVASLGNERTRMTALIERTAESSRPSAKRRSTPNGRARPNWRARPTISKI